jgi:phage recombination protein Bet
MTTELAVREDAALAALHQSLADSGKLALIRRTVAEGTNDDEFGMFIEVCRSTGLNPFMKQIYAIARGTGKNRKVTIQTGIDGLRLIAERSGAYYGQEGPWWCGEDGEWREVWLAQEQPAAARVGVKKGFAMANGETRIEVVYGIATFDEFAQFSKDWDTGATTLNSMWTKMGRHMLAKCAEALALRKAFPAEMAGLYTTEEMGQAETPTGNQSGARTTALAAGSARAGAAANQRGKTNQQVASAQPWMETLRGSIAEAGFTMADCRPVLGVEQVTVRALNEWAAGLPDGTDPVSAMVQAVRATKEAEAAEEAIDVVEGEAVELPDGDDPNGDIDESVE